MADLDEHQGQITLDDMAQSELPAHGWRKKVALLCAETSWWFDTVGQHFTELPLAHCQALGFEQDISHWSIARLSSGEKQRLGLLRLLQNQPQVLLLDEPTANLDAKNSQLFENFILDYLSQKAACGIWVSHDEPQLQKITRCRFELKDGELIQC